MSQYYRSYSDYLKEQFPYRVYKVPIDPGFSCPNIDGTVAYGGCTFCDNKSFSPNSRVAPRPIRDQILSGLQFYRERFGAERFIIYFQAFTNTHAPVDQLKTLYDEALSFPGVIGLSIGTRPDCVGNEVLDLLSDYASRYPLWVEYGIQTIHDDTLALVNRGHTFAQFIDAVERTKKYKIPICTHVILGLPGETHAMMMETAEAIAHLSLESLKIHHLYISKNTQMEKHYHQNLVETLSLDAYIPLVCDFLERMPPSMVIQRLMGEVSGPYVVAPLWNRSKGEILTLIDQEFRCRGTRQGAQFHGN